MSNNLRFSVSSWEEVASQLSHDATDTDRLMAAICYRFEYEEIENTDISAIENDYFRRARWPKPSNLAATANHCAGKGWLSEAGKFERRKLWRITRKGFDSIKEKLN